MSLTLRKGSNPYTRIIYLISAQGETNESDNKKYESENYLLTSLDKNQVEGSPGDNKRKLAHVEKIAWIKPIEGADNIELVGILGWVCITKKGEFKPDDTCIYFEIDSKLKETEWSEFLRPKHFKIKTMKLSKFKVISQGLALPVSAIPELQGKELEIGQDVTDLLGVTYSVDEDNIRKSNTVNPNDKYNSMASRHQKLFKKKPFKWLMRRPWGRKLLFIFFGKKKDKPLVFPTHFEFVHKTDETRCENIPWILEDKQPYIVTTKVDGTSSTYILERKNRNLIQKILRRPKFEFYVLSRNVRQMTPDQNCYHDDNVYWNMEFKYNIRDFLQSQLDANDKLTYVCLQGETAGVGVQGNPHKLKDTQFFGFNYIDSINGRWNSEKAKELCSRYGIQWVPVISNNYILPDTMEELKLQADGQCEVPGSSGLREGYVYRSLDGKSSFKNVSRKYLLKKGE